MGLLPIYGTASNRNTASALTTKRAALAARLAQSRLPGNKRRKVIVLDVRGNTEAHARDLQSTGIEYAKAGDLSTPAKLTALNAGDVIVLHSVGLPQRLFNSMFRMATYPMFVEGANTAALALSSTIPFVMMTDNYQMAAFLSAGPHMQGARRLQKMARVLAAQPRTLDCEEGGSFCRGGKVCCERDAEHGVCKTDTCQAHGLKVFNGVKYASEQALLDELAAIFEESGDVDSAMGKFYRKVAEESADPANDQLSRGFVPVAEALGA